MLQVNNLHYLKFRWLDWKERTAGQESHNPNY